VTVTAPDTSAASAAGLGERDRRVADLLRERSSHPSAFLTFNDGTEHYIDPAIDGAIAYRTGGRGHVFQLCGPFAAPEDKERLLQSFKRWAKAEGRKISALQLLREDAELYAQSGFTVNEFGTSYTIDLEDFTLRGTRFMKLRNKLKRSKRLGVTVEEVEPERRSDPEIAAGLDAIDADWLRAKGRLVKQLEFMVGQRGGRGDALRRLFVARHEGRVAGYVTYSPAYGERPGWLYDLTRRSPDAPPGTVELIFHTALEKLQEEGCRWLHLGLTPFVGLQREHEVEGFNPVARVIHKLVGERAGFVYPAQTQVEFKLKWAPQAVVPEYIAWQGNVSPGAIWQWMRVTRTI
jgi:lysylphosphatidylglycerol synthetase-like protein (DUF2156 family)